MALVDGSLANAAAFNNEFVSKVSDSVVTSNIDLNSSDVVQGVEITKLQRELNSLNSFSGKTVNTAKDVKPTWASTNYGSSTDSLQARSESLDVALASFYAEKASANGVATLDAGGTIPMSQIPAAITNDLQYISGWDATANTPTLSDATGTAGYMYAVTVGGSQDLGAGVIAFTPGDLVIHNGTIFEKVDGSQVSAFNGRTGAVIPQSGDYTKSDVGLANVDNTADTSKAIAGDVTGTLGSSTVVKLQNRDIDATAPTNGYVLMWNSTSSKWEPTSAPGSSLSFSYRSVTTTDTATTSDYTLDLSGASFTQTIYTAVGNTGKILEIIHSGTSLTQEYTLNSTSGQTIGGHASGVLKLYTNGERFKIQSDGSNWRIVEHKAETNFVDAGALVITASTTDPTKGGTVVLDKVYWRRVGQNAHIMMNYRQTTVGVNGSGDYLFNIPSGLVIDTGIIGAEATAQGVGSSIRNSNLGNFFGHLAATVNMSGGIALWDSTKVTVNMCATATTSSSLGTVGSGYAALGNASVSYHLNFTAPIVGWLS
jgi:hypothetical protein